MADAAVEIADSPQERFAPWSLAHCILFRFVCLYWLLFLSPVWRPVAPTVATRLFHVASDAAFYKPTGSGDTALSYVEAFLSLVAALAGTLIWSVWDRRREEYVKLHGWLRLLIRYCLALALMVYGFVKVFPLQFPANSLVRMSQEFGSFSPMGVVWSFMGASAAYSVFAGLAELTGGILLCFRRTTLIGAMCAFGVMTNVAALNYCYDIPVKLHSTHLLLMAVFLLAPDAQRMADVFLFNRAAQPADLRFPEFAPGWQLWVSRGIWMVMVGSTLIGGAVYGHTQFSRQEPRPPLYGLYQVEDGAPAGWLRVVIEAKDHVVVRMRNGSTDSFFAEYDTGKQTLELNRRAGFASLQWSHADKDLLELTGTLEGEPVKIRLRRIDGSLLQRSRGFHWVQEYPFNR